MKRRGDRIVMITAYDAPSGRIADAAGVDLILVGDSAAMVVLGHDSTVPATMDEMIILTRAVNRGARRPLVVADLPFGSFQVSDRAGARERDPLRQGSRRRRREAGGSRPDALARPRAHRRRRPRDGPHRPDAADGDDARRLQGAGPDRRQGGAALRGRARAAGGRVLRDRPRGRSDAGRRRDHARARDPDDRDRRRRRLRRPGARVARPARAVRRPRAALRQAVRGARADRSRPPSRDYAAEVRSGSFPAEQHTYSIPEEELALFEEALAEVRAERCYGARGQARHELRGQHHADQHRDDDSRRRRQLRAPRSSRAPRGRRSRAGPPTRAGNPSSSASKTPAPAPWSLPPVRKRASP